MSESSESKLISEPDEVEDIVDKNRNLSTVEPQRKTYAAKKASTLAQSKRPDWDSRSFRSRSDVTALLSPDSPLLGREPYETRFQRGTEIRGFNQIEKFLRHITPQNKLYCFSQKTFLWLGAL